MKTVRTLTGLLLLALMAGSPPTGARADEEKRGFKPGRFIGKLIPGGRDREETPSPPSTPGSGDAAVVVPSPENPVVAPIPGPSTIMAPGERIPPPPIPGATAPATNAVPSPFVTPEPEEKERGILGGVRGMVGKVIPSGRDGESATVAPPPSAASDDDRGLIGRLRDRRGDEPVAIPPPMIIPRPVPEPAAPVANESLATATRTLTIPTTRSGNPNAPLQREERPVDPVAQERTGLIEPTVPTSSRPPTPEPLTATTQAEVGRMALGEPPAAEAAQVVSEPITPSVPVSQLTPVPDPARPAEGEMPVAAVPPPPIPPSAPAASGLVISDGGGGTAPVSVAAPPPSAVSALTGQPAAPAAPEMPAVARVDTNPKDPATGGTHFVTVRDGVAGALRLADGRGLSVEGGTVLKFLSSGEGRIRVRLPDGSEADIEAWQVRDATFDEAVEFVKQSD